MGLWIYFPSISRFDDPGVEFAEAGCVLFGCDGFCGFGVGGAEEVVVDILFDFIGHACGVPRKPTAVGGFAEDHFAAVVRGEVEAETEGGGFDFGEGEGFEMGWEEECVGGDEVALDVVDHAGEEACGFLFWAEFFAEGFEGCGSSAEDEVSDGMAASAEVGDGLDALTQALALEVAECGED